MTERHSAVHTKRKLVWAASTEGIGVLEWLCCRPPHSWFGGCERRASCRPPPFARATGGLDALSGELVFGAVSLGTSH